MLSCYIQLVPSGNTFLFKTIYPVDAAIYNAIPSIFFILICLSFSLSVYLLKESGKNSASLGGRPKKQRDASVTVVIVSSLFIVFNVPFVFYLWDSVIRSSGVLRWT